MILNTGNSEIIHNYVLPKGCRLSVYSHGEHTCILQTNGANDDKRDCVDDVLEIDASTGEKKRSGKCPTFQYAPTLSMYTASPKGVLCDLRRPGGGPLKVWDWTTEKILLNLKTGWSFFTLDISLDGQYLLFVEDQRPRIISIHSGSTEFLGARYPELDLWFGAIAPVGENFLAECKNNQILLGNWKEKRQFIVEFDKYRKESPFEKFEEEYRVSFSENGDAVFVAMFNKTILEVDTSTGDIKEVYFLNYKPNKGCPKDIDECFMRPLNR